MARNGTEATSSDPNIQSTIEFDGDEITLGPNRPPPTTTLTRRWLRRLREPGLILAATGLILLAVHATGGEGLPTAARPPASSPSQPAPTDVASPLRAHLRLLAPQTAVPGERLTVLAYRNRRLCGPAELRFDGKPTTQRLLRYVGPANPGYAEMFIAMDVPRSARPGSHVIELYGPRRGGPAGPICGQVREHQARLATTAISVEPHRN